MVCEDDKVIWFGRIGSEEAQVFKQGTEALLMGILIED